MGRRLIGLMGGSVGGSEDVLYVSSSKCGVVTVWMNELSND